jgi:hypothetical protein
MLAAKAGHAKMTILLLQYGALRSPKDIHRRTALMEARRSRLWGHPLPGDYLQY